MLRSLNLRLEKLGPAKLFILAAALLAGLAWLDFFNDPRISLVPLEWVAVAFAAWYIGPEAGALFAAVGVALASVLEVHDHPDFWDARTLAWAGVVRAGSYFFMVWICDRFRGSYFRELEVRRETQAVANRIKVSAQTLIGHEIANAVTVLETAADLMAKDGGEGRAASLDAFRAVLAKMQTASREFLEETRLQSARISEKYEQVDLTGLIAGVVEPFQPLLAQRRIAVTIAAADGDRKVWADRAALSLVLSNLVSNAVKYSGSGGRLAVKVEYSPGGRGPARVEVWDSGPGISPEALESGTGFKMIRDLLRLHNTFLDVESAPGKGARFSFSLNEVSKLS